MKFRKPLAIAVAATTIFSGASHAVTVGKINETTVTLGGFIKLDAISTDYSDGTAAAGSIGRDFYVPSTTPVGGESENRVFDMHARQTRFNLGTLTELDGHKLKTFIELDFMATPNGDERISNSYTPRLRHAFLQYDNWLMGQTWSTFQNVGSLPETVDFIGNTDFGIFVRQAQIRYTAGGFQFAVENPETTITPFGGGGRIVADDNMLPDFVARYNLKAGGLDMAFAGLARELSYNTEGSGGNIDSSTTSFGLSITGKYTFPNKSDLRFGVNTGSGMGRYIGLNVANGAVLDADGELEAIDSTAAYIAYRHMWNAKWRSNVTYSAIEIDNDTDLTGMGVTSSTSSVRVNLFYSPVPALSFGGEVAVANRELESEVDGSMTRLQFTAKLGF
ncbi:DcaP family trimeric outer membrane transporter [Teredinibacter turnerae]|uniref:DcaP family trimeric outer membrane transporter n=1 Tax=Teredinibacter turnerae TaxID=2426 RepID=UPI00035C6527|nr:DcaP family trimeric outer membrane transporter [Teredinibacter turnerae]